MVSCEEEGSFVVTLQSAAVSVVVECVKEVRGGRGCEEEGSVVVTLQSAAVSVVVECVEEVRGGVV